ncbi:MAG: hypothetical protein DSM107014_02575 [Gomphosphaeria aponina SAG 52.96 = DSM 107014]|uniref:Uncharacterized protein n=1 Tax=Gomphosphaeria aponina SAG 52.96 = DSM 107014 TaxID=1521640 RepID=A0A941JRD6_9CHRO|nr:hypothetical protein [Gomphosphaeria aponina SAG 52.96 = DSM 107014]
MQTVGFSTVYGTVNSWRYGLILTLYQQKMRSPSPPVFPVTVRSSLLL